MDNTKVRLTVLGIPGRAIKYKPQDYSKKHDFLKRKFGENIHISEVSMFREFMTEFCSFTLNLSKEAYNNMTMPENKPFWYRKKDWNRVSRSKRLEIWLDEICKEKNGLCYIYNIVE